LVEKPSDEARIGIGREAVGDRLGKKAAQPPRLDLWDPARRLAVLEPRGRAEERKALDPRRPGHRHLLAEIAARRVADEMRALDAEMVEELGDIGHEAIEGERLAPRRHLRAAMAAQVEPHHPV